MMNTRPCVRVACAIIERDGRILAVQRSRTMSRPLKWEFPGGKVEKGEAGDRALIREIDEELGLIVRPFKRLKICRHRYADIGIALIPWLCRIEQGRLRLTEHQAYRWLAPSGLSTLDWAAADLPVMRMLLKSKTCMR
ncbi:MAG: (deoxy)nucleoside triphosphate pyrophosphohydrolase [Lentisphaerae bacterium]|nr:(deoxy)nucleoside triphosphate pyrophosphohydrolase [Lentisphaerota bacterium]